MPTPMIDPINVCELEAGKPRYQVPRFQMIAAISNANTMAKPAALPTWRISSTGSSDTMLKATAPDDSTTPRKLKQPDQQRNKQQQVRQESRGLSAAVVDVGVKAVGNEQERGPDDSEECDDADN